MKILVDTSIWIDHLARGDLRLARLLDAEEVFGHRCVTAEVALGSLADPPSTIRLLKKLPQAPFASDLELLLLIEQERLGGTGIGYADAHLLAACRLANCLMWTRDRKLFAQAARLVCAWTPD